MEDDAVDYVRQILEALRFMHERNVVHLDLKVGWNRFSFPLSNCGSLFPDDELTLAFFLLYLES